MNPSITIESSIFYLVLAVIAFAIALVAEKTQQKFFVFLLVFVLSIVAGMRAYSVGRDTHSYISIFETIENGGIILQEIGFEWFSKIILWLTGSKSFLLFVYALIIYGCIVLRLWDFRECSSFSITVITFYSLYYFESLNIMRQFVAMAILFYATRYLAERGYIKYLVALLIATTFHTSALLGIGFLAVELFQWKTLKQWQKYFLLLASVCGVALIPRVLSATEKYSQFFRWTTIDIGMRVFALISIWIVSLFYFRKVRRAEDVYFRQSKKYLIRTTQVYYLIGCLLGIIGYFYDLMGRISIYYGLFFCVYFGIIAKEKKNGLLKIVLNLMIAFVIVYVLYNYLFTTNGSWHHPYKTIWN